MQNMASNDSGVDTSNESNDSSFVLPSTSAEIKNIFGSDNKLGNAFTLPPFPQDFGERSKNISSLPSCSYSLKIRLKNRHKSRINTAFHNDVLTTSKERKLRLAASTCNIELLTRLLYAGTNPNSYDEHRRSPLHLAACQGYIDIVQHLLKHGANPNIVDSLGNTPLHLAVISASSNNFNIVVTILLQNGASVHVVDRNGKNPLELAESKLRLMRSRHKNSTPESIKILEDMCFLVALILRHFCRQKKDIDDLDALEKRLQNLTTNDGVANEAADTLLASVERLSISK